MYLDTNTAAELPKSCRSQDIVSSCVVQSDWRSVKSTCMLSCSRSSVTCRWCAPHSTTAAAC